MNVNIQITGLKEVIDNLDDMAKRQVPFALKNALNNTAEMVKTYEKMKMKTMLDRPTPHALRTLVIEYAKKNNLEASIMFTDKENNLFGGTPGANFMFPQVEGGIRNQKRFEHALQYRGILPQGMYVTPGVGCQLDAYGNIPVSLINQVISYFGARYKEGYNLETTDKKKSKLKKGSKRTGFGYEYFVSTGSDSSFLRSARIGKGTHIGQFGSLSMRQVKQHLPAGIYKKVNFSSGTAIKPIFMFVKAPIYQKRFPFYEIAKQAIDKHFTNYFNDAMRDALRTAK